MKYKIYQITNDDCEYKFDWWKFAKDQLNLEKDYEVVYEGEIEPAGGNDIATLEELFTIFNVNHPKDFTGHSLSVSDVVELDGVKYYCDSMGWEKLN